MPKSLRLHASKSRLLLCAMPALGALALAASLGPQASRSLAPTWSDMPVEASSSPRPSSPALSELIRLAVSPAPEALAEAPLQAPTYVLALAHEHLSRVNHLARARTLRELGDLSGAVTECRRALHDTPEDEEALRTIAWLGPRTRQPELALLSLAELGRLNPEETSPLVQQARLLVSLGRYGEAARVGEEAISRDPEEPEAYLVLGRAHLAAGHLSEAIPRLQQAVHLAPENGFALNNLGLAWLRTNENARAAEVLARAAALLPYVAYVHNNLGVAYERLGRTEEAQAAYAAATRLSPRYVKARVNASRMNKVASLGVMAPALRDDGAPGLVSQDTGL